MRKLTQRGDTIVEVLISIAVVSLILGGAFVTTNRSQTGVRNSQEHGEALKLVGAQLEQLRADAAKAAPTVFAQAVPFCMYNDAAVSTTGATAADCKQSSAGNPTSTEPIYRLSIDRTSSNGGYLFTVKADWDQISGGTAEETMVYRLYQ